MGDAPGLGTPGTIGDHVRGNEADNAEVARVLGCRRVFDLNYNNHRMGDVSLNELIGRLIFLIRLLKADTVVCWDPWGHDEENPDHYTLAKAVEAAGWMAGRAHDFPEHLAAGLQPKAMSGQILLRAPPGDHPRRRHQQADRQEGGRHPCERCERARRTSRFAATGGTGGRRAKPAAARRGRRHGRSQLHQGVRTRSRPRLGKTVWRGVCRGVPLHPTRAPRERIGIRESTRT